MLFFKDATFQKNDLYQDKVTKPRDCAPNVVGRGRGQIPPELSPGGGAGNLMLVSIHHDYDSSPGRWSRSPHF